MNATEPPLRRGGLIGFSAGVCSGLFGVGGGSVIVPGALSIPGVDERNATAASLLAITVMATVGAALQAGYGICVRSTRSSWCGRWRAVRPRPRVLHRHTQLQAEATSLLAIVPVSLVGAASQY